MHSLSPFQFLPPHIVESIVNHVAGRYHLVNAEIRPGSKSYLALLRPLLSACSNFRTVALALYCHRFCLDVTGPPHEKLEQDYMTYTYIGHPTHHLAKHAGVKLRAGQILSREALELLASPPYDGCTFPLARVLKISINTCEPFDDTGTNPVQVDANIGAFVQRIKDMTPLLSEIRVNVDRTLDTSSLTLERLGDLVSRLFRLANRIESSDIHRSYTLVPSQLETACHLSHIKVNGNDSVDGWVIQLVRQNAPTLQVLNIDSESESFASSLVQDTSGSLIAYPGLTTLRLFWRPFSAKSSRPVYDNSVVLFPSLRRVELVHLYPFGDDTLFRGNAATLERLTVCLDAPTVALLRRHGVFTPTSHPKL
ncbi:hypothetical protein IWW38_003367, partial [Coemansia aciculifera]